MAATGRQPSRRISGYPPRHAEVLRGLVRYVAIQLLITGTFAVITTVGAVFAGLPAGFAAFAWALFLMFGLVGGLGGLYDNWRYVRIIPYFQRNVGDIDTFLAGQAVARSLTSLDAIASARRVPTLSSFGFHDDLRQETLVWHPAADGLRTVIALQEHLTLQPLDDNITAAVLDDLKKLEHALSRAAEQHISFCLLLLHGNSTSGHEWSIRKGTAF